MRSAKHYSRRWTNSSRIITLAVRVSNCAITNSQTWPRKSAPTNLASETRSNKRGNKFVSWRVWLISPFTMKAWIKITWPLTTRSSTNPMVRWKSTKESPKAQLIGKIQALSQISLNKDIATQAGHSWPLKSSQRRTRFKAEVLNSWALSNWLTVLKITEHSSVGVALSFQVSSTTFQMMTTSPYLLQIILTQEYLLTNVARMTTQALRPVSLTGATCSPTI